MPSTPPTNAPAPRQRVAVLGGGMGALAAAVALTDPGRPGAERLDLTLYQLGWRLGGKGASGRSLDPATFGRIEEHGLHNLFGFYDHTFRLMRGVHDQLRARHGIDRGDFMAAVSPESAAVFVEDIDGRPRPWHIHNPTNARVPGDDGELTLAEAARLALDFLRQNLAHHDGPLAAPPRDTLAARAALRLVTAGLAALLRLVPEDMSDRPWWDQLAWLAARTPIAVAVPALELLRRGAWLALRRSLAADGPRRLWIVLHFATAVAIGLFCDRAFERGLASLNHLDFRAWLRPHLLDDGGVLARSVLMRVVYDSSFAYRRGDTTGTAADAPHADYEAGTLLAGLLRAAFTYKGAFGWKLRGGTGDVLIAPIYQLLRARGVRFRFFHRVDALVPAADGRGIERVLLTRQARPLAADYAPLVDFAGVPCWPNRPLWDQLAGAERLTELDLEDPRVTPPGAEALALERGVDFDAVILGVSAGALPTVAAQLIAQSPRWRTAVARVATTRTQALQVWLRAGAVAPGHGQPAPVVTRVTDTVSPATVDAHPRAPNRPTTVAAHPHATVDPAPRPQPITGFWYDAASPLNVWADMSHLIAVEGWPGGERPAHLSYYVSPLADDPDDPRDALARVHEHARRVLAGPGADQLRPADAPPFAWRDLLDRHERDGPARLDAQYLRANTHPSDRYVLSVAGSSVHRLPPHDPGDYANLYLAGDWTHNGMNCGAMESAVLGGLLAARAFPA